MMLKVFTLIIVLTLGFHTARAQSVISFAGGKMKNSTTSLSFSAGEVINGSFSNESFSIQNGFSLGYYLIPTSSGQDQDNLALNFKLNQNYPNPFNPSTTITYEIPISAEVKIEVFNAIGVKVATLAEGDKSAGMYTVQYDFSHLASGMYLYRLTADGRLITTRKMMFIK